MDPPIANPRTSGPAFRVTIMGPQQNEAYPNVHAVLDDRYGVVHIFSADAQTHYLTVPIACALIEWRDPAALEPQPRMPPFGPGAFEKMGEQMQRFAEGVGRAFGQGPEG